MSKRSDEGLGLIEIVISMFLFLLLAVAFLPLLVNGLKVTASNATLATATQLTEQQLQLARQQGSTCDSLKSFMATSPSHTTDPRGTELYPRRTAITCPTSASDYPRTVKVEVKVRKDSASGQVLSEATTRILVSSKN